jgi:hypothetical protein
MRCFVCILLLSAAFSAARGAEVDFDTQVRLILSDNCFQCHGPDEQTREADLRLDTREGAFADLGGRAAFVAGSIEDSEALRRIFSDDEFERMPPPDSKLTLSDREKQVLRQWVESGAEWSAHWAFVPPQRPDVPPDESGWSRNAIDHFIRVRAVEAGLTPGEESSRETLIRRLSLDLTGLPPTPEEVRAFAEDDSENAYEQVVDRLLNSPAYGERMAWEWLDAARYADTDGFQGDPTRTMWPWRDWLVQALNGNMPFDQFTIEMLAGDLLPEATAEQVLATGFNRNHMFNGEGGRIPDETRVENVFDRTETTATVWLGLTMTCCRCHDHKFDPISLQEYYQFYAFFNNTSEDGRSGRGKTAPVLQYLEPEIRERRDAIARHLQDIEQQIAAPLSELDPQQAKWEGDTHEQLKSISGEAQLGAWWQLGPIEQDGRKAFDEDFGPEQSIDLEAKVGKAGWIQNAELKDGAAYKLSRLVGATYLYRVIESPSPRTLQLSLGSDDAIKVFLNGREVLANFTQRGVAADQEKLEVDLKAGRNDLLIKIVNTGGPAGFYFRKVSESILGLPTDVVAALQQTPDKRTPEQIRQLREYYRSQHWEQWSPLAEQRDRLRRQRDQLERQAVAVMVMDELQGDARRQTPVLERGGYDKPTDQSVTAGTPAVLPPLPADAPRDRLTLARWLVDAANPLTARVIVNRYWQTFFGRGIVESTEDFGLQGTRPSHPELLDWLAVQFTQSGWNVKELHKLIVMSATYRQSSQLTDDALQADPENRWLARGSRHRLPSWMLRDQALAVGGLLNPRVGGPPVKPYQPAGVWAEATFGKITYEPDTGGKLYRRSLYVFWRRIVGPTMFFDSAKRQTCEVKPTRTNTPLHALTTLNDTTYVEAARGMAQRVLQHEPSREPRLRYAFQLASARAPDEREVEVLSNRLAALRQDFADHPDEALDVLAVGESPRDESLDPAEHAAWTLVCSILLNLDETLSRQ